jgi:hypothetical protein
MGDVMVEKVVEELMVLLGGFLVVVAAQKL